MSQNRAIIRLATAAKQLSGAKWSPDGDVARQAAQLRRQVG